MGEPSVYESPYEYDNSDEGCNAELIIIADSDHVQGMAPRTLRLPALSTRRERKRFGLPLILSDRIQELEIQPDGSLSQEAEMRIWSGGEFPPDVFAENPPRKNKKLKVDPALERFVWLKKSVLAPPELTLRDRSAMALAAAWTDRAEVESQMEEMGDSDMALVFKAEVGVYLKGHALAAFVRREGGLETLMHRCWPEVFQRLLTSVYKEISRFDQTAGARQALSRCVREFREKTEARRSFHPAVHRLGLTASFEQHTSSLPDAEEVELYEYYWMQEERHFESHSYPPLKYPLPYALRNIDSAATTIFVDSCFEPLPTIRNRQKFWRNRREITGSDIQDEENGKVLSQPTADFRQRSYTKKSPWLEEENLSPFRRHLLLLCAITRSYQNHSLQAVVVMSVLALADPFYSASRMTADNRHRAPLLRPLRFDVYWYLARALSWLHVDMDLPLACLERMKRGYAELLPPLCLGDRARIVLAQLEIFVRYGYYKQARDLFWLWHDRLPSTSRLYEELVLIYCAGALHAIQDEWAELKLTILVHQRCRDLGCWKKHVVPMLRSSKTKMLLLKSILLRCLSDMTLREDFRRDCNNALLVCQMYLIMQKKLDVRDLFVRGEHYQNIRYKIMWNECPDNSPHLRSFLWVLPWNCNNMDSWAILKERYDNSIKPQLAEASQQVMPRMYADYLFSLLTTSLVFNFHKRNRDLIQETQTAYLKSTGGRHHRIAILGRLLAVHDDDQFGLLPVNPTVDFSKKEVKEEAERPYPAGVSIVHPQAKLEELTGAGTVQRSIDEFATETMRHSLGNFRGLNWNSDEAFCQYLRDRDSMMAVHFDVGLRILRFAKKM